MAKGVVSFLEISIHALREESDKASEPTSTHKPISIHALREESDSASDSPRRLHRHFNPRSP